MKKSSSSRLRSLSWRNRIDQQREDSEDYDRFAALVEKYMDIPRLTTTVVNEFMKKIIVHEADNSSQHRRQTVEIVFNFVDQIIIPILTEPILLEASPKQKKTAQPHRLRGLPKDSFLTNTKPWFSMGS